MCLPRLTLRLSFAALKALVLQLLGRVAEQGCDTTPEQKRINRLLAGVRSAIKHPFRVLKCQFGYRKVRYRGLFKNEQHLFSLFALVNLYRARRLITQLG